MYACVKPDKKVTWFQLLQQFGHRVLTLVKCDGLCNVEKMTKK